MTERNTGRGADQRSMDEFFKSLPLERCTLQTNPYTKETEWKAPNNFAFRITGQFQVIEASAYAWGAEPISSWDLLIAQYAAIYQDLLFQSDGNVNKAMRRLVGKIQEDRDQPVDDSYPLPPKSFTGKFVSVSKSVVTVKQDLIIDYLGTFGTNRIYKEDIEKGVRFNPEESAADQVYIWEQNVAEAYSAEHDFTVKIIKRRDKKPVLYVPRPDTHYLEVPRGRNPRITSVEFCNVVFDGQYAEEERLAIMRHEREQGFPFSDDPLQNYEFRTELDVVADLRALYQLTEKPRIVRPPLPRPQQIISPTNRQDTSRL